MWNSFKIRLSILIRALWSCHENSRLKIILTGFSAAAAFALALDARAQGAGAAPLLGANPPYSEQELLTRLLNLLDVSNALVTPKDVENVVAAPLQKKQITDDTSQFTLSQGKNWFFGVNLIESSFAGLPRSSLAVGWESNPWSARLCVSMNSSFRTALESHGWEEINIRDSVVLATAFERRGAKLTIITDSPGIANCIMRLTVSSSEHNPLH